MRIGIDLGVCTAIYGGIGRYVEELTRALLAQPVAVAGPHEFVLFAGDREPAWLRSALTAPASDRVAGRTRMDVRYTHAGHPAFRANVFVGPQLARMGIHMFHAPDTLGFPLTASRRMARIVTIHDLIPQLFPQTVTYGHRLVRCAVLPSVVARADLVIVNSQATAEDVAERFPSAEKKMRVVYMGVDDRFAPATSDAVAAVRQRYGLPVEYLLYVGVIKPVKNLDRLFQAYGMLARADPNTPPLVVAGRLGWLHEAIIREVGSLGLMSRVIFPGFVPDRAVPALMTGAIAFLFPSLYEGFGLPMLEAMACGTPVVTSDRSSLPEIAGGAALLVDPEDPESIADGIRRLLDDAAQRKKFSLLGIARARRFRWDDAARQTVNIYQEALTGVSR